MEAREILPLAFIYCIIGGVVGGLFYVIVPKTTISEALAAGACWPLVLLVTIFVGIIRLAKRGTRLASKSTWEV